LLLLSWLINFCFSLPFACYQYTFPCASLLSPKMAPSLLSWSQPINCYFKIIFEFAVAVAVASLLSCCLAMTVASTPWLIVAFLLSVDSCLLLISTTANLLAPKLLCKLIVASLDYPTLLCCSGCPDMHQQPFLALPHNNRQLPGYCHQYCQLFSFQSPHSIAVAVLLHSNSCFQCTTFWLQLTVGWLLWDQILSPQVAISSIKQKFIETKMAYLCFCWWSSLFFGFIVLARRCRTTDRL